MKNMRYILGIMLGVCLLVSGCQNMTEPERSIPTIETKDVINVTSTQATFGYKIEDMFLGYHRYYILLSTSPDMSNAEEYHLYNINEYMSVNNLTPETTYYYVACASDDITEIRGEVKSFTTLLGFSINSISLVSWDGEESTPFKYDGTGSVSIALTEKSNGDISIWKNFRLVYNDQTNMWGFENQTSGIKLGTTPITAYAYYPNNNHTKYSNLKLTVVTDYTNYDYLYGCSEELTQSHSEANIKLKHALARVILSVTKKSNSSYNKEVLRFTLWGDKNIYSSGILDITTGEITNLTYNSKDGAHTDYTEFVPSSEATQIEMFAIPTSFKEKEAFFNYIEREVGNYSGKIQSVYLPASEWKAGYQYTYPIIIGDTDVTIGDVIVEEWNNNNAGDITVND